MRPTLVRTAKLAAGFCFDENTALDLVGSALPPARRAAVLAHAESCETCRRLLADLADFAEPAAPILASAPPQVGAWQILERAGSGAGGTVYRARNLYTGVVAAVKLVTDPGLRVRFEREARALATLDHPGIVRYIEHGQLPDGTMFLVMQWLEGHDLSQRLPAGQPVPEAERLTAREVLDLALRLTSALAHAHSRSCVHRDLSPKNVFLPGGVLAEAMILDFGLVRWVNPDASQTASQAIVGTPYYMAPEQIRGVYDIDARADLFALGVLLYQAAASRLPFEGDDLLSVWHRIVHAQHPDLGRQAPHLPRSFVDLIGHLLEKAPSDRPASAEAVLRSLESVRLGDPNATARIGARGWLGLGVAAVAGGAAIVGLAGPARTDASSARATPAASLGRRDTPAPVAPLSPAASVDAGPARTLSFVGGSKTVRGQRYAPPLDAAEGTPAISVLDGTLVLEDCVLEGPDSANVLGGHLVLRRCRIEGNVTLMNDCKLTLERSDFQGTLRKVGFTGHVVEK